MLYIDIYLADGDAKPTGNPLNVSPFEIDATDVNGINFSSVAATLSAPLTANTQYCLVVSETPDTPNDYKFRWFSTNDISSEAYKNNNGTLSLINKSFYYKIFYNGVLSPTPQEVIIDFNTQGDGRGYTVGEGLS